MTIKNSSVLYVIIMALSVLLIGCDNNKPEPEAKEKVKSEVKQEAQEVNEGSEVVEKKVKPEIKKLMGTWVGTLDKRKATLVISEETDKKFKGKITINYRNPVNQEVEGSYDESGSVSMKDMLHSRYKGTYSGKLIEGDSAIRGTFKTLVDKNEFDFILTKQK
jgi:ABC-type enterochelin transport system substrate-binding protein